ncbi:MAG: DsbA family protein [Solobacterium sp.]|nr:DsbA family protein [Solobacterium sp.]
MDERIVLTVFTDPMMGLSYESEPIMERLQKTYAERIEFRYVMCLLVRDVSDFMLPEERAMDPESGIQQYCKRLASIYKSEESIGHLPMNMEGFCLFDTEHRTSAPLNLAYKAAQLADPAKADTFLTALRHATVLSCRPTTHLDEILKVVRDTVISEEAFLQAYNDGRAEAALQQDLAYARRMGIHSLPAYLIQYKDRGMIMQSFAYQDFVKAITQLTETDV